MEGSPLSCWVEERRSWVGERLASGLALRSGRRPMFIEIRNPWGVELLNYRVVHGEISDDRARLSFSMDHHER